MRREYREKALQEYDEECEVCGATENIHIHHIDGDDENNDIENLIPLCGSCHRKVHYQPDDGPEMIVELGERITEAPPEPHISGGEAIKIRDEDAELIDEMIADPYDELTWAEKVHEVVDKAYAWEERGSDVL